MVVMDIFKIAKEIMLIIHFIQLVFDTVPVIKEIGISNFIIKTTLFLFFVEVHNLIEIIQGFIKEACYHCFIVYNLHSKVPPSIEVSFFLYIFPFSMVI